MTKRSPGLDLFARSEEQVYRVSELSGQVRRVLEERFALVRVVGEVSNLTVAASGHAYFNLKDDKATLSAVMFRSAVSRLPQALPGDGDEVECLGRLTMYEPRGRTQLVLEWMALRGAGALELEFQKLKRRLEAEGLFAPELKQALPALPGCVGVVTSPTGAAIKDILKVLGRRFPSIDVIVLPVLVQGPKAPDEIARAIARVADGKRCQVLIVGRGGGSLEDLWAFNTEEVVRAIAAAKVPVVSAVGHETDLVLSDLVADVRAPTPSAAAEMVVPDRLELSRELTALGRALGRACRLLLSDARSNLLTVGRQMRDPRLVWASHRMRLDDSSRRLHTILSQELAEHRMRLHGHHVRLAAFEPRMRLSADRDRLSALARRLQRAKGAVFQTRRLKLLRLEDSLESLSPLAVLRRGYALVADGKGRLVRDSQMLEPGELLSIRLHRGELQARVEEDDEAGSVEN